jgi:uncharacterized protein YlxP (DUF503 family)
MCCRLQLFLGDSHSLKDKRQVLNSLKERIHHRFNVSVAEVDDNELWQRAALGIAVVSSASRHANEVLSKIVRFVEQDHRVQILDYCLEAR